MWDVHKNADIYKTDATILLVDSHSLRCITFYSREIF